MTKSFMRLVVGTGEHVACIWEPGVMRSLKEARSLLASGCAGAEFDASTAVRVFLATLPVEQAALLEQHGECNGRLVLRASQQRELDLFVAACQLALDLGLSVYRPPGSVEVRLGQSDCLGLWRALHALASGKEGVLEVASAMGVYQIVHALGSYDVTTNAYARRQVSRLRLLGFRRSSMGSQCFSWRLRAGGIRSIPTLLQVLGCGELDDDAWLDVRLVTRDVRAKLRLVRP